MNEIAYAMASNIFDEMTSVNFFNLNRRDEMKKVVKNKNPMKGAGKATKEMTKDKMQKQSKDMKLPQGKNRGKK